MSNPAVTFARHWHHLSAQSQTLGPLSVRIATLLMGKHKPRGIYTQSNDQAGDYVVVTQADRIMVTGKKAEQKMYYRHSMYPGGLKVESYQQRMNKKPEEIIRAAVSGMLPKNKLRDRRLERLKIFIGDENPYAQNISRRYDVPSAPQVSSSTTS
ncbi:putative MRPL23-mitochondrial ribosomal protein, large subunit [Microstroma glucosiphilum]|uniref:Putative MRPL23-mitochondrial ribosomal protein, large subunit n=1 Tax=Pseudomicrostroma glucosiphilum TaxID=1684307 RepID=A0A316U3R5_9BASI|nr:putative MRPL23-mitochondrial ribosomal protein, large subunit [Pseudomicrostroma glucosiphilum]PWN19121.1 putative MRPL23-mitochondrial ribosomal protein, large subunit [Pseudomicrostroma glucosiphilum]